MGVSQSTNGLMQIPSSATNFNPGQMGGSASKNSINSQRLSSNVKMKKIDEFEVLQGSLQKKSPSYFSGWQERYVILKDKKLKYFTHEGARFPQGVLNFDLFSCELINSAPKQFAIKMAGADRLFEFQAFDEIEANDWKRVIQLHIDGSQGRLEKRVAKGLDKPWRFDNISEE